MENFKRCATCVWFEPVLHVDAKEGDPLRLGKCKRHAPRGAGFPRVMPQEFCGEHVLDVDKLV